MDHSYIMPFIKSVQNVFATMLQMQVKVGKPFIKTAGSPAYDISGIIGMAGDVEGAVVLNMPTATAEGVVARLTGAPMACTHADFPDAVGELVNMVSGGAKAQFPGKTVNISCPSVVIGHDHHVLGCKDVSSLIIPCTTDCGEFCLEISIRQTDGAAARKPAALATA
ncbi:MAG: chemotaxis protein CheX [Planctomycetota bacterium]|nr:chemotaxis protein CheX [Planctomycetota bacterium]